MDEIKQQKIRAKAVQEMCETKGWEILEEELVQEADTMNNQLIDENDIDKIKRLQSDIRAIKKFINKIVNYNNIK